MSTNIQVQGSPRSSDDFLLEAQRSYSFPVKLCCSQDTFLIVMSVVTLQLVASSGLFGCTVAVIVHMTFVFSFLHLTHKVIRNPASMTTSIFSSAFRLQHCLRVWLFTFIACQYLVYQFVVITFREIYALENVIVLVLFTTSLYSAFLTMTHRPIILTQSPRNDINFDDSHGIFHPHECIWLGVRVPSSGPIARWHFLAHLFIILTGCYGAHQTSTAVCTPIMVADFFLVPSQCSYAFADIQMPVVTDVLTAFADVSGPWRGCRQGFYYGFRIRFAHSLVMALLFKKGSWRTFRSILGKNQSPKKWVVLISGIIAGALAFGRNDHISEQVNLYMMSRVIYALLKLLYLHCGSFQQNLLKSSTVNRRLFASLVWATALLFFEFQPNLLHDSLRSSMEFVFDMPLRPFD